MGNFGYDGCGALQENMVVVEETELLDNVDSLKRRSASESRIYSL